MKKILITGGAGYIGSHMVLQLIESGYEVIVLDNLSSGYADSVLGGKLIFGDLSDLILLDSLFSKNIFLVVVHFAASIQTENSVKNPGQYYKNNVSNTLNLLNVMLKYNVKNFIFSSTAAIFGNPKNIPISVDHEKNPLNPYGRSKWIIEQILKDYDKAYGMKSICLRYFNAAGADPKCRIGERHDPETHLIPLVLQTASGRRDQIHIFGNDYDTPDGTCVRDYIHVVDLCRAHLLALKKLIVTKKSAAYNLGNGTGFSVFEVVEAAKKITKKAIKIINATKREGDPAYLIADSSLAKKDLNWEVRYKNLEVIIQHAWEWERVLVRRSL